MAYNSARPLPALKGQRVLLRPFAPEDITDGYIAWLNDPVTVRFSNQRFIRHDRASCARYLATFGGTDNHFLSIRLAADDTAIGTLTSYTSTVHGTVDIGILIGEQGHRGQGLGLEAFRTLANWWLAQPRIRKVTAGTLRVNSAMVRLAEKAGLHLEAVRHAQELVEGQPVDVLYFARFAERASPTVEDRWLPGAGVSSDGRSAAARAPDLPTAPGALAVIAHDAGAANVLLPWLDAVPKARAVMRGPAERLWRQRFPHRTLCADLQEALGSAELVLTGTGWASSLEHEARIAAAVRGLKSAAVIDHWVNYPQRFDRNGITQWPDEFWVTDEDAWQMAARYFPGERIRLFGNPYLEEQARLTGPPPASGDVLYVLEPMHSNWERLGPDGSPELSGEFQALAYFMHHRDALGIGPGTPVRVRPHPSDPPGRYDAWLAQQGWAEATLDVHANLCDAMRPASWVVGAESMALVVALASGRRAACSLPPWAPPCRLPHRGIKRLAPPRL